MTILGMPIGLAANGFAGQDLPEGCGGCGDCVCGSDEGRSAQDEGFSAAISMAEAADAENITWWNEIRSRALDSAVCEYTSSMLLARMIRSEAHRQGVPVVDVWDRIRRTGDLPL